MRRISYNEYFDKVFGCWLGKSISGTIGAPFEGRKELFNYKYDPKSIETLLPNDDLDLQVLWLEVMEKKGIYFTSEDLADAFLNQCPYSPGEYAIFKKNYSRGIRPPYSGVFNNSYYINGMGCPIRSEIWGCISAGNSDLAAEFSWKDGVLDHGEDSVQAEVFMATLEAEAFFEKDVDKLIEVGLSYIPKENKVSQLIRDVISWYKADYDFRYTRELIINNYGHPDCTNLYENIGITILGLLYGKGDFIETTMISLNCGYDTDCTCATVGAILGIIYGAKFLMERYSFIDTGYILGVNVKRRSNLLYDLAEDTCRVGLTVNSSINKAVEIYDFPEFEPVPTNRKMNNIEISVHYPELPALGIGESRNFDLLLKNCSADIVTGLLEITLPHGWKSNFNQISLDIPINSSQIINLVLSIPKAIKELCEKNIISLCFRPDIGDAVHYTFGVVGAAVWKMYGPFWENNLTLPSMDYWTSYYKYIKGADEQATMDITRIYHLSTIANIQTEFLPEPSLSVTPEQKKVSPSMEGKLINIYTDKFSVNNFIGLQGPCVLYLERFIEMSEEKSVGIQIGHTDAYKFWVNGELLSEAFDPDWCTNENKHLLNVKLIKGTNRIIFKLSRRTEKADFSLFYSTTGTMTDHYFDFVSINPMLFSLWEGKLIP